MISPASDWIKVLECKTKWINTAVTLRTSGIRLMTNLARDFEANPDARYGITTMCIGLGMGGTVIWERVEEDAT